MITLSTGICHRAKRLSGLLVLLSACLVTAHADTLDEVKERGYVRCGINQGLPGFADELADGT